MLQHYIKMAIRNLLKYKVQSLISITGMAIGLICFCYGWRWLQYETSYDGFYPQSDRICMLYGIDKQTGKKQDKLPLVLARKLKQDFPEVKETTQIYSRFTSPFKSEEKRLEDPEETFIDEHFFQLFPQRIVAGRQENLLQTKEEIVVNRTFATRYFGSPEKAVGKVIRNGYRDRLVIVAVMEDSPHNSMFQTDVFELDVFDRQREAKISEEQKWKLWEAKIYLLLEPNIDRTKFEEKINRYIADQGHNLSARVKLLPLTDVRHTLGSELSFNLSYIRTFTITGSLLLFCVFFNFINLLLNRIYLRNREMKLRNAIGADKKSLIIQLMLEMTFLVLISVFLAYCLLEITATPFSDMFETRISRQQLFGDLAMAACLSWLLLAMICLPLLLRFIRATALLASGGTSPTRKGLFRKISLTAQLGICVFFLMSTFIMFRQISFMKHKELGFEPKGLIQMYMNYRDRTGITQEIATLSSLKGFTQAGIFALAHEPQTQNEVEWEGKPLDFNPHFQVLQTGETFPEVMGIRMLKGRYINDGDRLPGDHGWMIQANKAVINEEAARIMGMDEPIGKIISIWNYTTDGDGVHGRAVLEIVGVISNFQAASLRNPILPLIIIPDFSKWNSAVYFARTTPGREKETIGEIRQVYKKHYEEGDEAEGIVSSMTEILDKLSTSEKASLRLFTLLSLFCTLISVFGLYSISSSNMQQRRKEIAVRKVMGASATTIIGMFFREYITIALVANLVALPVAWLFMQQWLEQYPYRIGIGAWMYGAIVLVTITLILCTVLYQTVRTARTNPAQVIKSE